MKTEHTPTPWRIGDAGCTIFGPPNGNPSPETVARLATTMATPKTKANARLIVLAVNHFDALLALAHNVAYLRNSDLGKSEAGKLIIDLADKAIEAVEAGK